MKKTITILLTILLAVGLLVSCQSEGIQETESFESEAVSEPNAHETVNDGFGSAGAFESINPTIEEMLVYAIQDEYAARAEYEFLINDLGAGNPFVNIMKAEETHIAMLLPLFETYGYEVPEDTSSDHLIEVSSITEALEAGVLAEINNIAMYEMFLEQDLPSDITAAFTSLRDASMKHQDAFQRKLDRS